MRPLTSCSVAVACIAAVAVLSAQSAQSTQSTPTPANNEPHHKRLLYTNDIRMFEVTVPPGEDVADHVHEYDLVTVVIDEATVRISRNGEDVSGSTPSSRGAVTVTEQTGAPATYRIQNTGSTPYRVLEVENMREGGGWLTPTLMDAPGMTAVKQSRAFTIYDGRLKADAPAMHAHTWSSVLVLLDGTIESGGIGGEEPVRLQRAGQWLAFPRAVSPTVGAVGADAHILEIEAR